MAKEPGYKPSAAGLSYGYKPSAAGLSYGYKKLILWRNLKILRRRVYEITKRFPRSELKRVSQMNDAARSGKQNVQEGYGQSLPVYLRHLGIAGGSVRELSGDIDDCWEDGLITEEEYKELKELCGKTEYLFMRLIQALRKKQAAPS